MVAFPSVNAKLTSVSDNKFFELTKQKKISSWIFRLENRVGVFGHVYYLPKKFGIDYRFLSLAASVRSKEITRKEALKEYRRKPKSNLEIVEFVKKRLELSDIEFDNIMKLPIKSARDYPTYKRIFEFLRPLFFVLAKQNLVPMSFYLKYCFPFEDKS